jgi:hypothetical protein
MGNQTTRSTNMPYSAWRDRFFAAELKLARGDEAGGLADLRRLRDDIQWFMQVRPDHQFWPLMHEAAKLGSSSQGKAATQHLEEAKQALRNADRAGFDASIQAARETIDEAARASDKAAPDSAPAAPSSADDDESSPVIEAILWSALIVTGVAGAAALRPSRQKRG